jgi:hypothetical protein
METNNDKLMEIFYNDTINKQKIPSGINTKARFKTMFADSGAFEGINNNKISIFEEAGLFENISMSFKATEPSFRSGAIQYGLPLVYGTGGEIDKGAKGYKEMWDKSDAYNLKQIFIPAYFYYPGDGIPDEKSGKTISFFNYETGVTDRESAKKYILRERKIAEGSKDTYIKHIQSYPLIPEEVFLKTKGGILDLKKLNFQLKEINEQNMPEPVLKGTLEWEDSPKTTALLQRAKNTKERTKIRVANESKVVFKIDDENGYMLKIGSPINKSVENFLSYKPDIGGCDSYDEEVDQDNENVSSGAIIAYRCFSGPLREFNYPVGLICQRGDGSFDDDVFYENCVKFAIYWDMEILIEYTKFHIMRYFFDVGANEYVRGKPVNIEENATDNHKNNHGVKMDGRMKGIATRSLKSEVKDNIHNYWMAPVILDLIKYGDGNTDIASALIMCLIFRMDLFEEITEDIENMNDPVSNSNVSGNKGRYHIDINGNLAIDTHGEFQMESFLPHRDLSKPEYERFLAEKEKSKSEFINKRDNWVSTDQNSSMAELIRNEQLKWIMNNGD